LVVVALVTDNTHPLAFALVEDASHGESNDIGFGLLAVDVVAPTARPFALAVTLPVSKAVPAGAVHCVDPSCAVAPLITRAAAMIPDPKAVAVIVTVDAVLDTFTAVHKAALLPCWSRVYVFDPESEHPKLSKLVTAIIAIVSPTAAD
jgi:hypothetical protein